VKSADIQREIILALRCAPRGLDHFQIAASTGQAASRIQAELKSLEREQRVHQAGNLWKLTDSSPQPL
jgi:predicted transcriptional regulator